MAIMNKFFLFICTSFFLLQACNNTVERDESSTTTDSTLKSIEELNRAILNRPNNSNLYYQRASLYFEKKDWEAATGDLQRSIKLDSSNAKSYILLGDVYFTNNKTSQTKSVLELCVKKNPRNTDALLKLAELHFYVRKYQESIGFIDKALKIDQYLAKAYFFKGLNFKEMGDTAKAISSMQTAVEQDQQHYNAFIELGLLHAAKKNPLAFQYYDNALRIKPKDINAMYNKAKLYQDMADYKMADSLYKKLLMYYPQNSNSLFNLGAIKLMEGKQQMEAIAYFDDAIRFDSTYFEAFYARGVCYTQLGDKQKAASDFKSALQINPSFTMALEAYNSLK